MDGLRTQRLLLRRWRNEDRPVFHRLNSDDDIMRFFPMRRTRAESDAVMDELDARLEREKVGFLALERSADKRVIGILGMGVLGAGHPFAGQVEIGWRLVPEAQGHGYATEGADACLAFGFGKLDLAEIVSQCATRNLRSEAVMLRLGFRFAETFDHPSVDAQTHPELVRHSLYRLRREDRRSRA